MTNSTFEIWRLGPTRDTDRCERQVAKLTDAIRTLDSMREQDDDVFEIRVDGKRVDIDDGVPLSKRSTRRKMRAEQG